MLGVAQVCNILKQQTHVFNPLILDVHYDTKSNLVNFKKSFSLGRVCGLKMSIPQSWGLWDLDVEY